VQFKTVQSYKNKVDKRTPGTLAYEAYGIKDLKMLSINYLQIPPGKKRLQQA
jgi:hypothetical protein